MALCGSVMVDDKDSNAEVDEEFIDESPIVDEPQHASAGHTQFSDTPLEWTGIDEEPAKSRKRNKNQAKKTTRFVESNSASDTESTSRTSQKRRIQGKENKGQVLIQNGFYS